MADRDLEVSCGCAPVSDATYSLGSEESPSTAILEAVAQAGGVDVIDLPPLYEAVDPSALDRIFAEGANDEAIFGFPYGEWNVFIRGDGRIRICNTAERDETAPVFERPIQ